MSATNAPQGFVPVFHPSGIITPNVYEPTVATNAAIYKGDPVKLDGTTGVVIIAAANDAILGVFAGCEYDLNGKPTYSPYWPGSTTGATNIKFYVYDDLFIEYEVQVPGSVAATAIGDSSDSVIAAGSAYTGVTGSYLSTTLSGAAAANQWRIVGKGNGVDNAWGDAYTVVRVIMAKSQTMPTVAAI